MAKAAELGRETLAFHRLYHEKISRRLYAAHSEWVPQAEFLTLCIVAEKEGLSMNELTRRTASSKQRLTVLVNQLEEKGYLRRERSESDRRITRLFLTGKSRALMADAQKQTESALDEVFSQMDASIVSEYLSAIRTLNAVLDKMPSGAGQ